MYFSKMNLTWIATVISHLVYTNFLLSTGTVFTTDRIFLRKKKEYEMSLSKGTAQT
jgi:hypothetical protein